jgi:hypothetical protein
LLRSKQPESLKAVTYIQMSNVLWGTPAPFHLTPRSDLFIGWVCVIVDFPFQCSLYLDSLHGNNQVNQWGAVVFLPESWFQGVHMSREFWPYGPMCLLPWQGPEGELPRSAYSFASDLALGVLPKTAPWCHLTALVAFQYPQVLWVKLFFYLLWHVGTEGRSLNFVPCQQLWQDSQYSYRSLACRRTFNLPVIHIACLCNAFSICISIITESPCHVLSVPGYSRWDFSSYLLWHVGTSRGFTPCQQLLQASRWSLASCVGEPSISLYTYCLFICNAFSIMYLHNNSDYLSWVS